VIQRHNNHDQATHHINSSYAPRQCRLICLHLDPAGEASNCERFRKVYTREPTFSAVYNFTHPR